MRDEEINMIGSILRAKSIHIKELEAKLAKAVEIIEAYWEDEGYVPRRVADIYDELKGETDE
jgi:transcription antitermination factor NusA-like protein